MKLISIAYTVYSYLFAVKYLLRITYTLSTPCMLHSIPTLTESKNLYIGPLRYSNKRKSKLLFAGRAAPAASISNGFCAASTKRQPVGQILYAIHALWQCRPTGRERPLNKLTGRYALFISVCRQVAVLPITASKAAMHTLLVLDHVRFTFY